MASGDMEPEAMTREEAKRILRRLELDAYSAIVTAFRAQGDVNRSKKSILNELSSHLSISTERHRAEVRRVVNDDRLNSVAECMHGPGTSTEWSIEGRRLVSLMPRLVPQTVFTAKATAAANQAVENNQKLPIKTEIEVLPLPTKTKGLPPKTDRTVDNKTNQTKVSSSNESASKLEDKSKKKKKPNILYTKPSPLILNKTLTNPFKPASLKPMIKSSPLKYSSNYSVSKTSTITPAKYTPKPIILQRSPTKSQPGMSRPPVQLHSLNSSNVNIPLTSLSTLCTSKPESSSLHLIQSPMIKVVSNSLQSTSSSVISTAGNLQSSITQKIKFKTPLPKPKVKATKFKPMVPLQHRPGGLLSASSHSSDSILFSTTSGSTLMSSGNSVNSSQNMSVKVVQVAKSGNTSSVSLISTSNKPVVVVSSNVNKPTQRVLAFNNVSSATTGSQSTKITTQQSSIVSASKGNLTSKSMPLATGFKMIAVTTVVPGTTQVKTVYIATPIMSLTKTISQTTGSSITTPAAQSIKHISSSLASTLHSVVARSMNTAGMNQSGKNLQNVSSTVANSITTPSIVVGKSSKVSSSAKGLGSLKTTLTGAAQSLKLFTAVSKGRSPLTTSNTAKNTTLLPKTTSKNAPLLPSTSLLSSVSAPQSLQRVGNIQVRNTDNIVQPETDKQQVGNITHELTPITNSFLNISAQIPHLHNSGNRNNIAESTPLQTTLTLNVSNFDDVSTTLNLLNENSMVTEQITASATAETDDMAFLNAGEKFLEQLSAKMTATSPDSLTKNERFMFPNNLSIDLANDENMYELNRDNGIDFEISNPLSAMATKFDNKRAFLNNHARQSTIISKESSGSLINQKSTAGAHTIGLVSSKVQTQVLSNNISMVNTKFNIAANNLNTVNVKNADPLSSVSSSRSTIQQNSEQRSVLNYPNITKLSGKVDLLNSNKDVGLNPVGFINVANSMTIENVPYSSTKLTSPQNKLQMSMPGSSKLNISPVLVNNVAKNASISNQINPNSEIFTQICTIKTLVNSTVNFSSPLSKIRNKLVTLDVDSHTTVSNNILSSSPIMQVANIAHAESINNGQASNIAETSSPKKRKISSVYVNESVLSPARAQASWIRGASNLLQRVSRFRGTNKQKGEMNAASWFTKPVDPNDAPGYYRIIKTPMDFGKIKRKLEDGEYVGYSNFYEDMMLVKKNCYMYNPTGHVARKDCDDVFSFFEGEYLKLLERWQKHHVSPQKKIKLSESSA